jgi:hypothetical protein
VIQGANEASVDFNRRVAVQPRGLLCAESTIGAVHGRRKAVRRAARAIELWPTRAAAQIPVDGLPAKRRSPEKAYNARRLRAQCRPAGVTVLPRPPATARRRRFTTLTRVGARGTVARFGGEASCPAGRFFSVFCSRWD